MSLNFSFLPAMKFSFAIFPSLLPLLASFTALAGDPTASTVLTSTDTRYGPFDLLDRRTDYGQDVFPEPFLVDDSDLETDEFRLDWLYTGASSQHTDLFTGEIEHGIGPVTFELEVPVERDAEGGKIVSGFDNINPGVRAPLYEYVSPDGFINTTFGAGLEVGIPTNSQLSRNTELVPKLFNDLALGEHFTLQSIFGYSMLYGPGSDGGLDTFEYGFVFGYTIPRTELPIPDVQQLVPVFEVQGYKELNNGNASYNELLGNAAVRFNLTPIGSIDPRLGIGFVFPMDNAARQQLHWGVYTSLVFEY
ncbi:MAG: hypothetical protein ABSE62_05740 [Chthoniobacteraceae bacterium]|jgi:hypothetical protein